MCVYAFAYVYTCICVLAYACAFPHGHSELPLVELVSSALCDNAEEFIPLKLYHSCTQAVPWFSIQDMLHTDSVIKKIVHRGHLVPVSIKTLLTITESTVKKYSSLGV